MTRKRLTTQDVPPPSRAPRNAWQQKRDAALAASGYTKKDLWRVLVQRIGEHGAPSRTGVSAVIDNRYRDASIHRAFVELVAPPEGRRSEAQWNALIAEFFPADEPLYRRPWGAAAPPGHTTAA